MRRGCCLGWLAWRRCLCPRLAGARVLRVGAYHGIKGQYTSIQAAVNAAKPGDWILVGPGDYKTTLQLSPHHRPTEEFFPAGVLITTSRLRIAGDESQHGDRGRDQERAAV